MKKALIKFLTDKKIRYGAFSTVITLVFIALVIVVNLIIGELDPKFDLTSAETYSISEDSKKVLDSLTEEINIYTMFKTGNTDSIISRVQKVVDQYGRNAHITVENKDLYLYPDFAKKYSTEDKTVSLNSIIVTKGEKYRIINYDEYFDSSGELNIESCLTSAINYVGLESSPVIYAITGHGEYEYASFSGFVKQAELANYKFKAINLLEEDIPEDCAVLFASTGHRDYSKDEAQKIKDYLSDDGRMLFVSSDVKKEDHPNMLSIINAYGVDTGTSYVLESDQSNYIMYPFAVFPKLEEHDINKSLKQSAYKVLAYGADAINILELKKNGLEIDKVLTTSDGSYIKAEGNSSPNPEEGDEQGPFTLAAAITDSSYTDKEHSTKLMVIGCFYMLDAEVDKTVNGANATFLVNCLNWLNDTQNNIYIAPKSLAGEKIVIDNGTANTIKIFAWGVIPGILFIAGFIVYLTRRNG